MSGSNAGATFDLVQLAADAEWVAREALRKWTVVRDVSLSMVKLRENAVFKTHLGDGARYALRVHRPGYHSDEALMSEIQWMENLRAHNFPVAEVIPTASGSYFTTIRAPSGIRYQCDLQRWVDGSPLGYAESGRILTPEDAGNTYRILGKLAGELHVLSNGPARPARFARHAWDAEGCIGDKALWGRFGDLESLSIDERSTLENAAGIARHSLESFGMASDRYGLIHSDLVPDNVIQSGSELTVIDFDDSGYGWYMWELATAVFWLRDSPIYEVALKSFVDGYREARSLTEDELAMLPTFMLVRGLVYLGWFQTRNTTDTAKQLTQPVTDTVVAMARTLLTAHAKGGDR